jgi:hypothetical protein
VDTFTRSEPRTSSEPKIELVPLAIVAAGFLLTTLGILEIGGLFTVAVGLLLAEVGTLILFAREGGRRLKMERDFLSQLDGL